MPSNRVTTVKRPSQVPGIVSSIGASRKDRLQEWAVKNGIEKVWWAKDRKTAYFAEMKLREWFLCTKCNSVNVHKYCAYCTYECMKLPREGELNEEVRDNNAVLVEGDGVPEGKAGKNDETPGRNEIEGHSGDSRKS